MVLPSSHFTTLPFINWSRTSDSVTGLVYFELDWRTVRAKGTTSDTDDDWDLRCDLRERLIVWLRENNPEALPLDRVSMPPYAEEK